jgi:hypothetical protein
MQGKRGRGPRPSARGADARAGRLASHHSLGAAAGRSRPRSRWQLAACVRAPGPHGPLLAHVKVQLFLDYIRGSEPCAGGAPPVTPGRLDEEMATSAVRTCGRHGHMRGHQRGQKDQGRTVHGSRGGAFSPGLTRLSSQWPARTGTGKASSQAAIMFGLKRNGVKTLF